MAARSWSHASLRGLQARAGLLTVVRVGASAQSAGPVGGRGPSRVAQEDGQGSTVGAFAVLFVQDPMAALPPALRLHGAAVNNVQSSAPGTAPLPAIYRCASLQPRRGLRITP